MITGHQELDTLLADLKAQGIKALVYGGFDPTGSSLHLGHVGVISLLDKCKQAGHKTIALIGTGTAFIGDPTGKNALRTMLDSSVIEENSLGIIRDIQRIIPDIEFIRNDWLSELNLQDFLREICSKIPLNMILNLSTVKTRLQEGTGITLMESLYPVLQGIDMVVMAEQARDSNCQMVIQIGGVDQTGNISMGIHLVNRLVPDISAMGAMCNLITTPSGEKMGKSTGQGLFLDPSISSDLLFFDTIISMPDDMIPSIIDVLMPDLDKSSNIIALKKALAIGLTSYIRGPQAVENILLVKTQGLDSGNIPVFEIAIGNEPVTTCSILKNSGLVTSLSEARRMIKNKGIKINDKQVEEDSTWTAPSSFVLSKGKKSHIKVVIV